MVLSEPLLVSETYSVLPEYETKYLRNSHELLAARHSDTVSDLQYNTMSRSSYELLSVSETDTVRRRVFTSLFSTKQGNDSAYIWNTNVSLDNNSEVTGDPAIPGV